MGGRGQENLFRGGLKKKRRSLKKKKEDMPKCYKVEQVCWAGQGSCTGRERQSTPGGSLEKLHWSQRERTEPQDSTESSGTVTPPQSLFLTHLRNGNQILACSSGRVAPRIRVITNLKVPRLPNGRHYYEVAAPSSAF